jgi:hypothetical protein
MKLLKFSDKIWDYHKWDDWGKIGPPVRSWVSALSQPIYVVGNSVLESHYRSFHAESQNALPA